MFSMNILAIESSCDETAAAIVKDGREVLSNVVASQIDIHAKYGGVVPEVAARAHVQSIIPVIEECLRSCHSDQGGGIPFSWNNIDAIAVTQGPGLVGSLIVGTETARALSILKNKPLIAVNHLEGHIYANWVGESSPSVIPDPDRESISKKDSCFRRNDNFDVPTFPAICLLVSGGHTMLIEVEDHYKFKIVGQTRDDAAGEAFDKVAALLGLPYPGGPNISKIAEKGDENLYKFPVVDLTPEPKRNPDGFLEYPDPSLDFSLSGLKTAVLNVVKQEQCKGQSSAGFAEDCPLQAANIAASFQKTLVDTLVQNSKRAIEKYQPKSFILSGGVAANEKLREKLEEMCSERSVEFYMPDLAYCTDNAVMIGAAAYYKQNDIGFTEAKSLEPAPTLKL